MNESTPETLERVLGLPEPAIEPAPPEPDPEPEIEPEPEPTPKRPRTRGRAKRTVTVRNLTRRALVAHDANGGGIHVFPGVDVEIDADLVGPDLERKAKYGLIDLA